MIEQLILVLTTTLVILLWLRNRNNRLPPGPIKLPLLGSIIQIYLAHPVPHLALAKLAEKYGDVMSFGFGVHNAVVVSSFEVMQEVFNTFAANSDRFPFPYVPDRNYGKNLGIIWSYGQKWVDVRRYTKKILKEFGYGKIKIMDESLNDSANQLVDYIKMEILDSPDDIFFVDAKKLSVHVLNIVWNLAGGYKFDLNDKELLRNMQCVDKIDRIAGHANLYNIFPFLKTWFPKQVNYAEHLEIHNEIHKFTESLINDAKEKRSERVDSEPISFIEVFLDKIEENRDVSDTLFTQLYSRNGMPGRVVSTFFKFCWSVSATMLPLECKSMGSTIRSITDFVCNLFIINYTEEQLVIIIEDLFLGALATTGTMLAWSILFLILYPDVQSKLRQEILGKMKNRADILQAMELKSIPYVKAAVLEIFRNANILPMAVPRCPTKDIKVREYLIPKGTALFFNLELIYNDKIFWEDPENFRPERFIKENGEIDKVRSERILNTVFGVGPRVCFGETVAIDSVFMFLAAMVMNFKFDKIPGAKLPATMRAVIIGPEPFGVKVTTLSI